MIMFRVHFSNNTSLDVSALDPAAAKAHALKHCQGMRVMKVKRLKEQPKCYPFLSTSPASRP